MGSGFEYPDFMYSPHDLIVEGRGFIPCIRLPKDWKGLYQSEGSRIKEDIEAYVEEIRRLVMGTEHEMDIMLN